jgi:hypothetical protein
LFRTQKLSEALRVRVRVRPLRPSPKPRSRVLGRARNLVRVTAARRLKRRSPFTPQAGDRLWTKRAQPRTGRIRQWKTLRVQRNTWSFAGPRGRRPWEAIAASSGGRRVGSENTGASDNDSPTSWVTPTRGVTSLRQEVSGSIGLGQSSSRERSRWGGAEALWGESTRATVPDP